MKALATSLLIIGLSQLAISQAFSTYIINGDFENGLTGWTRNAEGGSFSSQTKPFDTPYPFAHPIALGHKPLDGYIDFYRTPTSTLDGGGSSMLRLGDFQGANDSFTAPDGSPWSGHYSFLEVGLHQDLDLMAGQTISGWSRFITTELEYEFHDNDNATVTIDDVEIWEKSPADVVPGNYYFTEHSFYIEPTDWEQWSWTAPADGTYRLSLNTYMDDQEESYGYFDNITVSTVDDTFSTIAMLSSAMGILLFIRRRAVNHTQNRT